METGEGGRETECWELTCDAGRIPDGQATYTTVEAAQDVLRLHVSACPGTHEIPRVDNRADDIAAMVSAIVDAFRHGDFESVCALPNQPGVIAVELTDGTEFFIEIKPA